MTREEQLACLTDRPCSVCKHHTEEGCCKWSCVFEEEPLIEFIPIDKDSEGYTDSFKCSNCNGFIRIAYKTKFPLDLDYNFCPYCGEKTKGCE